jgi:hypothetical protein
MSIRDEKLLVEVLDKERAGIGVFRLLEDFHHIDSVRGELVVPSGYETDFASIPYPCRWLIPSTGKSAKAALLHDYILARGQTLQDKRNATGIFNRALKEAGRGTILRWLMVGYVSIFTFPELYIMPQTPG